jgi:poly(3-hydroxybutyrate) depolymerase
MRSKWALWLVLGAVTALAAILALGPALFRAGAMLPLRFAPVKSPPMRSGALTTTNASGRAGAFFLPGGYASQRLPLMVAIHSTGQHGAAMVDLFREAAQRERFIVAAPDSRVDPEGQASWEVPDRPGLTTDDTDHIRRCVDEVLAMPDVHIDLGRTIIVGHAGGGTTAPYVASGVGLYRAFAVLHGGVLTASLGNRRVRGWFSTGDADTVRPPRLVERAADEMRRAGFGSVVSRVFHEGHDVGPDEVHALVDWWLRGGST